METSSASNSNRTSFWVSKFDFLALWLTFIFLVLVYVFCPAPADATIVDLVKLVGGAFVGAAGSHGYQALLNSRGKTK